MKKLGKSEREEYQRWLDGHRASRRIFTPTELKGWEDRRRREREAQFKFSMRNQPITISRPAQVPAQPSVGKLDHVPVEERAEYLKREQLAALETAEKMSRTAPAYNKGGDVYWTEEMWKDFGSQRRR